MAQTFAQSEETERERASGKKGWYSAGGGDHTAVMGGVVFLD